MISAWIRMAGLCVAITLREAAGAPAYQPVQAQLAHPRGGLPNVIAKLEAGRPVRIAYFGGSITSAEGWRTLTLDWFRATWPQSTVEQVQASIGGTGSDLGVFRVRQDVIDHKPDLVFVEFAVNDFATPPEAIWRQMEGIVRQIRQADPTTDICYVYTIRSTMLKDYAAGNCPQSVSAMEMLADHYGIPSINPGFRVAELHRQDKLVFTVKRQADGKPAEALDGKMGFSRDVCHPLVAGHELFTGVITNAITGLKPLGQPGPHHLPEPFVADHWADARMVPLDRVERSGGWADTTLPGSLETLFRSRMPVIYTASRPGETLTFTFRGSDVFLYDLMGPNSGQLLVTIDGVRQPEPVSRFDVFCSFWRMAMVRLAGGLDPTREHTLIAEIHSEPPDRTVVLNRMKDKSGYDPKDYDGTVIRAGAVLLVGQMTSQVANSAPSPK